MTGTGRALVPAASSTQTAGLPPTSVSADSGTASAAMSVFAA